MPLAATRTWLEMTSPARLEPAPVPPGRVRVDLVERCEPSFWRYLYTEVGRDYYWVDRLSWTDEEIREYLDGGVQLWLLTVDGGPGGYFELRPDGTGGVEIAYFGLLREFTGRGLGGHMLSEAVRRAWDLGATRVWLHTSTLDHPAALANYLKRGFVVVRHEDYVAGE
jgi:GNAT superfamily N-acetyltransferase